MGHHEHSQRQLHDRFSDRFDSGAEQTHLERQLHAKHVGHAVVDRVAGTVAPEAIEPLPVITKSFAEARQGLKKIFSDKFIDDALDGTLAVGGKKVRFIKSYFDQVPMTPKDRQVMDNPVRIAAVYRQTSEMLLRNLRVFRATNTSLERAVEIKGVKEAYAHGLAAQIPQAEREIVEWCSDNEQYEYPLPAVEYHGFYLDGKDLLNAATERLPDVETNFKVQRQLGGTFVAAFSDARVSERRAQQRGEEPDRRIYLNPDIEATPQIFEQILQMANEKGIKLQLKMLQRASELAKAHQAHKNRDEKSTLRGDGIVIYVNNHYEDQVLGEIMAIVEKNAAAFHGRSVSKMPAKIADGVAIGDEPVDTGGRESLTSHRAGLIEEALVATRQFGLTGVSRRDFFRKRFAQLAEREGINPDNFAFNA